MILRNQNAKIKKSHELKLVALFPTPHTHLGKKTLDFKLAVLEASEGSESFPGNLLNLSLYGNLCNISGSAAYYAILVTGEVDCCFF